MGAIIDVIASIGEFFFNLIGVITFAIDDMITIISGLTEVSRIYPAMIGWLPSSCTAILSTTFFFVIIYKIFGREG